MKLETNIESVRRSITAHHIIEMAEIEIIAHLIAAEVKMDCPVRRNHSLLEQEQSLENRRFARGVGAKKNGKRLQLDTDALAPCLEMLQSQEIKHNTPPVFLSTGAIITQSLSCRAPAPTDSVQVMLDTGADLGCSLPQVRTSAVRTSTTVVPYTL